MFSFFFSSSSSLCLFLSVSVYVLKWLTAPAFRRNNSLLERWVHAFQNINICLVWEDWDVGNGTVKDHKIRHRQVNIEMILTMVINALFNTIMLAPMIYTGDCQTVSDTLIKHFSVCSSSDLDSP